MKPSVDLAKWKKKSNPNIVLKRLEEIRILNEDGGVSFSGGFDFSYKIEVLKSMIDFPSDIHQEDIAKIISKSVFECSKNSKIRSKSVIDRVNNLINEYLKKPINHYWLLTTFNVKPNIEIPRHFINNCYITFYNILPKKFSKARQKAISDVSSWLVDKEERNVIYLVVSTKDKNQDNAVRKILSAIDLLRGIWNIRINPSLRFQYGGRRGQINQVITGALHTLHDKNGRLATEAYWYDPEYFVSDTRIDLSQKNEVFINANKIRDLLKKHYYKREVEKAILMYVKALDHRNYNMVLTSLWSVLEHLTNTLNHGYDRTIKRTIFQYKDKDYHKEELEHLRQLRNSTVHAGANNGENEIHLFQLKSYVTSMLLINLFNPIKFKSLEEFAKFLDLNTDINKLKDEVTLLNTGIKFLKEQLKN